MAIYGKNGIVKTRVKRSVKLVHGVGINDADYTTHTIVGGKSLVCPYYKCWLSMLRRCYSKKSLLQCPTYTGCTVAVEWHRFSTFRSWMTGQAWQGMELDKDLVSDLRVYSPETCVFVSHSINMFLNDDRKNRGLWPIGVYQTPTGKFRARVSIGGTYKSLGCFESPCLAHDAWAKAKSELAVRMSETVSDPRVSAGLKRYAKDVLSIASKQRLSQMR